MSLTVFLGGASSGKSARAEQFCQGLPDVLYVATGPQPDQHDSDWASRVQRHRERRPAAWQTFEGIDVTPAIATHDGTVLLDCVTLWVTGALDALDAWNDAPEWRQAFDLRTRELVRALSGRSGTTVVVSGEVGLGVVPSNTASRLFSECLGSVNQALVTASQAAYFVVAGRAIPLNDVV